MMSLSSESASMIDAVVVDGGDGDSDGGLVSDIVAFVITSDLEVGI